MKCFKNKRFLRLFAAFSAVFIAVSFASCKKNENIVSSAETEAFTSGTLTSADKASAFDFENAVVADYAVGNTGDELTIEALPDGSPVFSRPDVAEMKNGRLYAKSAGVTLLGFEGKDTAFAICVLPEGKVVEKSAGEPRLLEVGDTCLVEGFSSPDEYSVSDESVISLDGTAARAVGTGYAVVDASNASMPKLFAFLVFDRNIG